MTDPAILKREIKILVFDQYGTVVDMQKGLTEIATPFLKDKGWDGNGYDKGWGVNGYDKDWDGGGYDNGRSSGSEKKSFRVGQSDGDGAEPKRQRGERGGRHVRLAKELAAAFANGALSVSQLSPEQDAYVAWSKHAHAGIWRSASALD